MRYPNTFFSEFVFSIVFCILQPSFDQAPQHAFGIKHSPYLGNLKGDAWVPARTEVMVSPPTTNGNYSNSDTKTIKTVVDKGNVTSTSRTHSDGHKIRTETFTYTKGPTIRTSTTTTTSHQIAAWSHRHFKIYSFIFHCINWITNVIDRHHHLTEFKTKHML